MEIQLGGIRRGVTIVSEEDYPYLSQYSWSLNKNGYVKATINDKHVRMHRLIMNSKYGEIVDHKNGVRHDNRRENLVISDRFKNAQNRNICVNKKSSFHFGVFFKNKKFVAKVTVNKICYWIGYFTNEIEAAERYDMFVVHEDLTHKRLNFPEKYEEYLKREYFPPKRKEKLPKISPYIGVSKAGNKFLAKITHNNKPINILRSEDPIECARSYDRYIVENNIPRKKLNFPEENPIYVENFAIKTFFEDVDENTVKLLITGYLDKNILLDRDNYDKIKYCSTRILDEYVMIRINDKELALSRFLKGISDPEIYVDHIDNDTFNNKKSNLRISNAGLNAHNRVKQEGTSSKFIGVTFEKADKNWRCSVKNKNKYVFRQRHNDEEYAARNRDLYIMINLSDQHYKLNFTWDEEEEIEKWRDILQI